MKSFFSTLLATAFGGALWAVMVKVIAALILVAVVVIMFWGREIGLVEGQHARYPWQYSKVLIYISHYRQRRGNRHGLVPDTLDRRRV